MGNQMISRSEEEFELFQRMDIERRRSEAEAGAERKPRLIEESELPEFLLAKIDEEDDEEEAERVQQEELDMGRKRSRKDITYHEQMSEKEWLKAIGAEEEDSDDGAGGFREEETPKKKKKKRGRDEEDEESRSKKKKAKKKLKKKMKKLVDVVMSYEDADGRVLSEPFINFQTGKNFLITTRLSANQ